MAIKSLPQEWLWCETWCDDGSKKKAKTIDLCNNPKTKEPKLTGARRIIAEWESYDNELKQMVDEFDELQKQQQQKSTKKSQQSIEQNEPTNIPKKEEAASEKHEEL